MEGDWLSASPAGTAVRETLDRIVGASSVYCQDEPLLGGVCPDVLAVLCLLAELYESVPGFQLPSQFGLEDVLLGDVVYYADLHLRYES
jgi:hypothetical protein